MKDLITLAVVAGMAASPTVTIIFIIAAVYHAIKENGGKRN